MHIRRALTMGEGTIFERIDYDAYGRGRRWNENVNAADFNGVNGVTVQDIFDFLSAWLAGDPSADINGVNGVTVQDIFDFLTLWLAGGGPAIEDGLISASSDLNDGSGNYIPAPDSPIGYRGYIFNAEVSGGGLYTVRYRTDLPLLGRWLERDPAGFIDGANLYQYVMGNPIAYIDPWGLTTYLGEMPLDLEGHGHHSVFYGYVPPYIDKARSPSRPLLTAEEIDIATYVGVQLVGTVLTRGLGLEAQAAKAAGAAEAGAGAMAKATAARGGAIADSAIMPRTPFDPCARFAADGRIISSSIKESEIIVWKNGWRTPDGKFASPNPTIDGISPGAAAVDDYIAQARANGIDIAGTEVYARTPFGLRRYDVVQRNASQQLQGVEIKSSPNAFNRFDAAARQQSAADRWVNKYGADIVGDNAKWGRIESAGKILWEQ